MPMVRDVLYWPKHLRNRVKRTVHFFQKEELKRNLAKTDLRDVIIVCVSEALPTIRKMSLEDFRRRVDELKSKG
jgi:hypothetical protein